MRALTLIEQKYIDSYLIRQRSIKRFSGLFLLLISLLYLRSEFPNLLESVNLRSISISAFVTISISIMGIIFIIGSLKYFSNGEIKKISGSYNQRKRRRIIHHYIGKTIIQLPSAFLNSFELKKDYTLEVFSGKSGIFGFTPLVLKIEGSNKEINDTPSGGKLDKDNTISKIVFVQIISIILAFVIPFLIIFLFFKYGVKTQFITNFFNTHKGETQSTIEYLSNNDSIFNIIQFLIKNLFLVLIALTLIIVFIVKFIKNILSSNQSNDSLYLHSYQNLLNEYEKFIITEFKPVMGQAMGSNRTVGENYQDVMAQHNKYRNEFNILKKSLNRDEKKQLLKQLKDINKQQL